MRKGIVGIMAACLCMLLMVQFLPIVHAQEETEKMARDISNPMMVRDKNVWFYSNGLFDNLTGYTIYLKEDTEFTLQSKEGIASLYILFEDVFGEFSVTDLQTGEERIFGQNGFLHEFADLEGAFGKAPVSVRLRFAGKSARINEIYAFTSGRLPDFVQRWELPAEGKTDLVLFSTHGDDEQLFFAGMLPWYAAELDYQVQVVYMTNHRREDGRRIHEMLNGLWTVGVTTYPVFGTFRDLYSTSLDYAYYKYETVGTTREDILEFVVEQLRRFRPKVAVGHDLAGEYGHGMHMIYADVLCEAVEISNDPEKFPELAETYGVWDVPKTYLHLYEENPIQLNWDIPMESFSGLTAYQVTRDLGFPCHKTQANLFAWYFKGSPTAASMKRYSCCDFGLYRSTVGLDVEKQDFFENLTTHAEDEKLEAERLAAEEAARIEAEAEAARLEAERLEAEAAARETVPPAENTEIPESEAENTDYRAYILLVLMAAGVLGSAWIYVTLEEKKRK